jgi:hypothetical protein
LFPNDLPATVPVAEPDLEPFILQILAGEIVANPSECLLNSGASQAINSVPTAVIVGGTGLRDLALLVLPIVIRAVERAVVRAIVAGLLPILDGDLFGNSFFENRVVFIEPGVNGGLHLFGGMAGPVGFHGADNLIGIVESGHGQIRERRFVADGARIFVNDYFGAAGAGLTGSVLASHFSEGILCVKIDRGNRDSKYQKQALYESRVHG